jgi:hypothetical protein
MQELFDNLKRILMDDRIDYLIDTCFFIHVFEKDHVNQLKKLLSSKVCAMTSFNAEEFIYKSNNFHLIKHKVRKFLSSCPRLYILEIDIHPGDNKKEHEFVKSIISGLDAKEHDPSDAVLLAAAVKAGADVLTRDKHHIFNVIIENYLSKYKIKILNKMPI